MIGEGVTTRDEVKVTMEEIGNLSPVTDRREHQRGTRRPRDGSSDDDYDRKPRDIRRRQTRPREYSPEVKLENVMKQKEYIEVHATLQYVQMFTKEQRIGKNISLTSITVLSSEGGPQLIKHLR